MDVLTTFESCLTLMRIPMVLCALHESIYNLKVAIVAIVA